MAVVERNVAVNVIWLFLFAFVDNDGVAFGNDTVGGYVCEDVGKKVIF